MLKLLLNNRIKIKILYRYFSTVILLIIFYSIVIFAQNRDPISVQSRDSISSFIWRPKILPELNKFDPQNVSNTIQLVIPNPNKSIKYYDVKNVMPKNFWEMDYRQTSYYTPRIVSDKLAHMMDRPPPDSFVSLPSIALLAASLALQYVDIQSKIEIKASDYIIEEELQKILISLWQLSPQTAKHIYKSNDINKNRTMEGLELDLQTLIDKKLIKRKVMETEPDKYFAAQDILTVNELIKKALEVDLYSTEQKQRLTALLKQISIL